MSPKIDRKLLSSLALTAGVVMGSATEMACASDDATHKGEIDVLSWSAKSGAEKPASAAKVKPASPAPQADATHKGEIDVLSWSASQPKGTSAREEKADPRKNAR